MKKNFATNATSIAMPNNKKMINYLSILSLLFVAFILFSCSATNKIPLTDTSNEITKSELGFVDIKNNSATLSGIVVDKNGTAIKDVQLIFEKQQIALTDEQGNFSFTADKVVGKMQQIIFTKEGYNNAIRNYNAEMNDASFNVVMFQPCKCGTKNNNSCNIKNLGFDFENETASLSKGQKQSLDALIECLKLHPETEINIQYNTMYPKKGIASKRLNEVQKYFTAKGIMDYRIKKEINAEVKNGDKQIEIKFE